MRPANHNLPELLWQIDQLPANQRNWDADIIGYHLTAADNASSIKANGLKAHSSHQSYLRPECVYVFLDNDIHPDNIPILLGDVDKYALVQIKIPASKIGLLKFDGLYNMSFEHGYGAAMYFGDITADWISNIEILDRAQV